MFPFLTLIHCYAVCAIASSAPVNVFTGQYFSIDGSHGFENRDTQHLAYTIHGLMPGSNIGIDLFTGRISGSATDLERSAQQPISVLVRAGGVRGNSQEVSVELNVLGMCATHTSYFRTHVSTSLQIYPITTRTSHQL